MKTNHKTLRPTSAVIVIYCWCYYAKRHLKLTHTFNCLCMCFVYLNIHASSLLMTLALNSNNRATFIVIRLRNAEQHHMAADLWTKPMGMSRRSA